jgi:hypothetical protein
MLLKYRCNLCGNEISKLFSSKSMSAPFLACECGGIMEKCLPDFSTTSFEIVDNGNMHKKVELRKDAVIKAKEKGDIYIKKMEDREKIIKKEEH